MSWGHQPWNSSPLASSSPPSPTSSPGADAQARRRAQYKSQAHSSPTALRTRQSQKRRVTVGGIMPLNLKEDEGGVPTEEAPRKAFLRERFRARCIERAQKDRERKIKGKRHASSDASSDGDDLMGEDEDEETIINDELFRRIMTNVKRRQQHQYRLSYAYDVGSSFDPDMEDVNEWEHDLQELQPISTFPEDLEDEELAAYAEEYELHLEDIHPDQLFSLSDVDDVVLINEVADESHQGKGKCKEIATKDEDFDMTV
ncbi:hypothetical protein AcV5_000294 [Taiwanofungus camphoratus]|nr:hypothetical protein AcV5_000294 [Antrodia cinnamomea]